MLKPSLDNWTASDATSLYGVDAWGDGFFRVADDGAIHVLPTRSPAKPVDLPALVAELRERGAKLPLLIRFNEIIHARVRQICDAFDAAIADGMYEGRYRCVYPVKVNQQRHVVSQVLEAGRSQGFGLEAGSKAELLAVMAIADNDTPIICNGFKDATYIQAALLGAKLGRNITVVIEKYTELSLLLHHARQLGVRPRIGMRIKLAARGAGRWHASGGYHSKFGLTVGEILSAVEQLNENGFGDCFQLLHFHLGSQVTNIRVVKAALIEATRVYAHLIEAGAPLRAIDCGGGLGVDYDGSQSDAESSMNYSLQEYANDVVYYIQQVCDEHGVPHPDIITESGRAIAAHHSVLVMNVLGAASQVSERLPPAVDADDAATPQPLKILQTALDNVSGENLVESYHDGQQGLDMATSMFGVGHLTLEQRATAERQYWLLCRKIDELMKLQAETPDELKHIAQLLTDTYYINVSVFQSAPDSWAISHLFPVAPIHRLDERPGRRGVLGDITCDSDGKIACFSQRGELESHLPLHRLRSGEPYYIGIFLVGAYQETLGSRHNLFGDTNAAHVSLDENGEVSIETIIAGDTVSSVLRSAQFEASELADRIEAAIKQALREGRLDENAAAQVRALYHSGLAGYTYLNELPGVAD